MMEAPNTNNKESKLIGTGEGESPLAQVPFQKVEMRTMNSDTSSIAQSGGGAPSSYAPGPSAAPKNPGTPQGGSFNISDMSAPTSPSFVPPQSPGTPSMGTMPSGNGGKKMFLWIMIGLAILIILAAGFFFLYPAIKDSIKEAEPAPVVEETIPVEEVVVETLPETLEVHASFLKSPADITSEIKPSEFTAVGIRNSIQPTSTTAPLFKELIVKIGDNKPIAWGAFTGMFFPTFFTTDRLLNFESDFTFFSYTNKSGTWLGAIAKLKDSSDIGFVTQEMMEFKTEPNLKDFYLMDPGTQLTWKDGKLGTKPASILEFSTRGTEFAYAWSGRYLIITSNLEAGAEAIKRLGL